MAQKIIEIRGISIFWKVTSIIIAILMLVLVGDLATLFVNYSLAQSHDKINMAGRQRMLSQKMAKEAFRFALAYKSNPAAADAYLKQARGTMSVFENTLLVLHAGGDVSIAGRTITFKPEPSVMIVNQLLLVQEIWRSYSQKMHYILAPQNMGNERWQKLFAEMQAENITLLKAMNKAVMMMAKRDHDLQQGVGTLLKIIMFLSVLVSISGMLFFRKRIFHVLLEMQNKMYDISHGEGDLRRSLEQSSEDELGMIAAYFNRFQAKLRDIVNSSKESASGMELATQEIVGCCKQLADTIDQIASSGVEIADGAEAQSRSTAEALAMIHELNGVCKNTAVELTQAIALSDEIDKVASGGTLAVEDVTRNMAEISTMARDNVRVLNNLGVVTSQIDDFVNTISSIAGHTNLLALNAAIEAARAGDQGKGFAVVAEEVRKLAAESAKASSQITLLVDQIQTATSTLAEAADANLTNASKGTDLVATAHRSLADIASGCGDIKSTIAKIYSGNQQQESQVNTIAEELSNIDSVAQKTDTITKQSMENQQMVNAAFQEITALVGEQSECSKALHDSINQFKS